MAINPFNFGQNGQNGLGGCGCGGGQFGAGGPMGPGMGMDPFGMGGMNPMLQSQTMGNPMMNMFAMSMMAMMAQLIEMISGGTALSGGAGQFGPGQAAGGSPLNSFLGGGGGGGGAAGVGGSGGGGGGTATAPTGASGTSLGPASGVTPSTQNFINKAMSHQGAPYVFGAQGPNAFDCSGLVYYALKEAGIEGGRTTARGYQERYKDSKITRIEDLKPGDLVFFWSPNTRGIPRGQASHIEVYLGDGKTMGTDNPSEGARVEPLNRDTFIGGARVPGLNK